VKPLDHEARLAAVDAVVAALDPEGSYEHGALFMDWDGARGLVRAGLSIGSHTMRHAMLARETEPAQRADLADSRRLLESGLDVPVRTLAYPNGQPEDHDTVTLTAARAAGYAHAVNACGRVSCGRTPRYEIGRRMVSTGRPASRLAVSVLRDLRGPARGWGGDS
jgi:peptidoglycan/xylan/chitin deacetylase (PgdA/CDA1 family)